jgi:hypothetical protein
VKLYELADNMTVLPMESTQAAPAREKLLENPHNEIWADAFRRRIEPPLTEADSPEKSLDVMNELVKCLVELLE